MTDRWGEGVAQAQTPNPVLLQPGTESQEVLLLQRQMRLLGFYNGPLDGRYGEGMQGAIAAFQTSAGLPATGTLDQTTWQRMSNPQLLTSAAPESEEPPVLLSSSQTNAEAVPELPSPPTTESSASPAASPEAESAEPIATAPSSRENSLVWWLLGGVALAACLGGWLFLGKGKRRPEAKPGVTAPSPAELPSPASAPEASAATVPASGLDHSDVPLETTTRLSRGDVVDSLVQELSSSDSALRRHAIWELGQRGHSETIQPLVNRLLEADSQEKSLILAALAEISSRSLKPMHRALTLGLQDPSPEVRKNAIRDLSRVYDTVVQLSSMLAHATQDPDPGVQETAHWALNQLNRIPAAGYRSALSSEPTALEPAYDGDAPRSDAPKSLEG